MMYPERPTDEPVDRFETTEPIGRSPRVQVFHEESAVERGTTHRDERSLGELFSELTRETRTLVRQELELAKTEATEKAKKAGKDIGIMAAGGFVAYAGFIVLLIGIAYLLAVVLPLWLATVIVGAIAAGAGYALLQKGMSAFQKESFGLDRTTETLQEDKRWIKEQI
jgi:hypothetical protein